MQEKAQTPNTNEQVKTVATPKQHYSKNKQFESPYKTREGNLGPIQSKQGSKPPIQAKQRPVNKSQPEPRTIDPFEVKPNTLMETYHQRMKENHGLYANKTETITEPIQRKNSKLTEKTPEGSARFQEIATTMGEQHGVDTSSLKATHNSSFPDTVNAEATIQGNKIDFAPGKDTEHTMKHEVAHFIDNTKHGTPKGDKIVNGQKVDTTREQVVDRMAGGALQRKLGEEPEKTKKNNRVTIDNSVTQKQGFVDNRTTIKPESVFQPRVSPQINGVVQMNKDKSEETYNATCSLFMSHPHIHFDSAKKSQRKLLNDALNDLSELSTGRGLMNTISSNLEEKQARLIITPGEDWHVEGKENRKGTYTIRLVYAKQLPPKVSGVDGEEIENTYTVALGHELAHVQDHVLRKGEVSKKMKKKYAEEMKNPDPKTVLWSNEKEYSAIEGTENPLREELDLPKRKYHGSVLDYEISRKAQEIGLKSKRINGGIRKYIKEGNGRVELESIKNIVEIINIVFYGSAGERQAKTEYMRDLYRLEKDNMDILLNDEYTNEELLDYEGDQPDNKYIITEEFSVDTDIEPQGIEPQGIEPQGIEPRGSSCAIF